MPKRKYSRAPYRRTTKGRFSRKGFRSVSYGGRGRYRKSASKSRALKARSKATKSLFDRRRIPNSELSEVLDVHISPFSPGAHSKYLGTAPMGRPYWKRAKLCYFEQRLLFSGVAPAAIYNFKVNDLFDPDNTGIGGQAAGRDQLASRYKYYVGTGGSIKVSIHNLDSTFNVWAYILVHNGDVLATQYDTLETMNELTRGKRREHWTKPVLVMGSSLTNSANEIKTLRMSVPNIARFMRNLDGVEEYTYLDQYHSAVGSSPLYSVYMSVILVSEYGGNPPEDSVSIDVTLEQDAVWYDPTVEDPTDD